MCFGELRQKVQKSKSCSVLEYDKRHGKKKSESTVREMGRERRRRTRRKEEKEKRIEAVQKKQERWSAGQVVVLSRDEP